MKQSIEYGLNDAGKIYLDPSNEFLVCQCGWQIPYDPIPNASGYLPNWERMQEHQLNCRAHLIWWALNRRLCGTGHFVHKDELRGSRYCERCLEKGE